MRLCIFSATFADVVPLQQTRTCFYGLWLQRNETATNLCSSQLGPAYEGEELGVGDSILMKAIKEATGRSMDKIKSELQEQGDIGTVAQVRTCPECASFVS